MQPRSPALLKLNQTDAERRLWNAIRNRRLGFKFRRQHPIGPFVADFCCLERRLIVEVDGGQHCENPRDDARSTWLEARGWRVIRFWNNEVLGNMEGVLTVLVAILRGTPPSGSA